MLLTGGEVEVVKQSMKTEEGEKSVVLGTGTWCSGFSFRVDDGAVGFRAFRTQRGHPVARGLVEKTAVVT